MQTFLIRTLTRLPPAVRLARFVPKHYFCGVIAKPEWLTNVQALKRDKKQQEALDILYDLEEKTRGAHTLERAQVLLNLSYLETDFSNLYESARNYASEAQEVVENVAQDDANALAVQYLAAKVICCRVQILLKLQQEVEAYELVEQSLEALQKCFDSVEKYSRTEQIEIQREIAIQRGRKVTYLLRQRKVAEAREEVSHGKEMWNRLVDMGELVEKQEAYMSFEVVRGIFHVLSGNPQEGLSVLSRVRQNVRGILGQSDSILPLYMGSLISLATIYKRQHGQSAKVIYEDSVSEFDQLLEILKSKQDMKSREVYKQMQQIRKML